jgi:hypothetical protein
MRFMQINQFYSAYLDQFYAARPGLAEQPFQDQIAAILADGSGGVHMRSRHMAALGYDCLHVVSNCIPAQFRWAAENGLPVPQSYQDLERLVAHQIDRFRPDVLYLLDTVAWGAERIRALAHRPPLVLGWNAAVIPAPVDWSEIDVMLSSDEGCLRLVVEYGAKSSRFFRPHFPAFIAAAAADQPKQWDVVFTGQITPDHGDRIHRLCEVAKAPMSARGEFTPAFFLAQPNPRLMPAGLCQYDHGSVWGMEMYRVMKSARIMLNVHIDMAAKKSLNMRTFETIGTGSFLLTEYSDVLEEYFISGQEVETYRTLDEMIDKIYYYLDHEREREAIARRGQQRCLRDYSAEQGALELDQMIREHLG